MKRTIEVRDGKDVYYGGKKINHLAPGLQFYFKLKASTKYKYIITIVPGTEYRFRNDGYEWGVMDKQEHYVGLLCKKYFNKLFFVPVANERYDISVKKVKK